jgi:hypothetical protein
MLIYGIGRYHLSMETNNGLRFSPPNLSYSSDVETLSIVLGNWARINSLPSWKPQRAGHLCIPYKMALIKALISQQ